MSEFLTGADWMPISYRGEAGKFTDGNPIGWILHVQSGNNSPHNWMDKLRSPDRRFPTAWVAKDGTGQQYTELSGKTWTQASGNGLYWAFETEGYEDEPLTPEQIHTLALWHNQVGTPDVLANMVGAAGVGTHVMGGTAWGNHRCPGAIRAKQRASIIAHAKALRHNTTQEDVVIQADIDKIAAAVWRYDQAGAKRQAWAYLQSGAAAPDVAALAKAVAAQIPTGVALTQAQIVAATTSAVKTVLGSLDGH